MRSRSDKISFGAALSVHLLLIVLLVVSFDKTIRIAAMPSGAAEPKQEIIEAVMVSKKTLQAEVARLEEKEEKKRMLELERRKELERQEQEAKQKREKEEALAIELEKKNEELKKQAEELRLAQERKEKARQAKIKKEQEEIKKLQREKEELAAKQKAEKQKQKVEQEKQKEKELAEQKLMQQLQQEQDSMLAVKGEVDRYMMLLANKIHQNWRQPIGFDFSQMKCLVLVKLLPTGEVADVSILKSSGNLEFDRSTELAVRKASPLPMSDNPHVAKNFREFEFTFNPGAV